MRTASPLAALVFLLACSPPRPPPEGVASANALASDARPEAARVLDAWHAAAARADEAAYFGAFASRGVFIGTDATERWDVPAFRAYAHPRFAKGKAWTFRATRRALESRGDVVWFDEDLETERLGPARGSGVLVREGGALKIAHYVLSLSIPNERFPDVRRALAAQGDAGAP
jgi:hypothetical protein